MLLLCHARQQRVNKAIRIRKPWSQSIWSEMFYFFIRKFCGKVVRIISVQIPSIFHAAHQKRYSPLFLPQSHNIKYREHASQENWKKVMQIFPTRMCNVTAWRCTFCTAWRHSRLRAYWLIDLVGGGGLRKSMYSAFPGNCSVSYLSFVYGRSLWAELNGGENSLHWKANMLPLFSVMTNSTKKLDFTKMIYMYIIVWVSNTFTVVQHYCDVYENF